MTNNWMAILTRQVEQKGRPTVQRELDVSPSTLSLVLSGSYPASTKKIEKKVMKIYGRDGQVRCPHLGMIDPGRCVSNWKKAQGAANCGNPATVRLYLACRKCDFRG